MTAIGTVRQGIFEGRQRTADDFEAAQMRPFNQLLVARNNFIGCAHNTIRLDGSARKADIIDPDEDDDMRNVRQAQDITLVTGKGADAGTVAQHAIARDALI